MRTEGRPEGRPPALRIRTSCGSSSWGSVPRAEDRMDPRLHRGEHLALELEEAGHDGIGMVRHAKERYETPPRVDQHDRCGVVDEI